MKTIRDIKVGSLIALTKNYIGRVEGITPGVYLVIELDANYSDTIEIRLDRVPWNWDCANIFIDNDMIKDGHLLILDSKGAESEDN